MSVSQTLFGHRTPEGELLCVVALMRELPAAARSRAPEDHAATGDEAGDYARLLQAAEDGLRLLGRRGDGDGSAAAPVTQLKLPVFHRDRTLLLDVAQVAWLQADRHYARVTTPEGSFLSSVGLGDLECRLDPARFVRVHRSHIINLGYALELEREHDHGHVILDLPDRPRIPISRSRMEHVRRILGLA
ncbi:MAG: LytTR family DNA-binding domain-containing protein [Halofilum sp. (in: g-proteobacteria)]|nr:LytTR family DNA-binding domain-containing protein [Halofilum sp. (in: g-proteobacteria)]